MGRWATFIDSPHELRTRTPDNRDLVFLTGTAGIDFLGTGGTWNRDDLYILIGPGWARVDNVAPVASLAAIYNTNYAVNAGWAADNCRWVTWGNRVLLIVGIAVSDSDGDLIRVSYQATVIGQL